MKQQVRKTAVRIPETRVAFSITEVSKLTGLSRSSLYSEIRDGRLQTFKVGARTLVSAESIHAWIRACEMRAE